jgi:hypothetical protein
MKLVFNKASLDRLEKETKDRINRVIQNPQLINELGKIAVDTLKFTARKGISPETGERFKPLSKSWKNEREKIAEASPTHPAYSKTRSNLTLTGQLLDAIKFTYSVTTRSIFIRLFMDGTHQPYRKKYMESFVRKKKKRKVNLGRTVKGFEKSFGGMSYVNTGRSGFYKVGKEISNLKLAQYVTEAGRPFFGFSERLKDKLLTQMKKVVIRYIRRNL